MVDTWDNTQQSLLKHQHYMTEGMDEASITNYNTESSVLLFIVGISQSIFVTVHRRKLKEHLDALKKKKQRSTSVLIYNPEYLHGNTFNTSTQWPTSTKQHSV